MLMQYQRSVLRKQKGGYDEEYPIIQTGGAHADLLPGSVPVGTGPNGISYAWAVSANRHADQRNREMADQRANRQLCTLWLKQPHQSNLYLDFDHGTCGPAQRSVTL